MPGQIRGESGGARGLRAHHYDPHGQILPGRPDDALPSVAEVIPAQRAADGIIRAAPVNHYVDGPKIVGQPPTVVLGAEDRINGRDPFHLEGHAQHLIVRLPYGLGGVIHGAVIRHANDGDVCSVELRGQPLHAVFKADALKPAAKDYHRKPIGLLRGPGYEVPVACMRWIELSNDDSLPEAGHAGTSCVWPRWVPAANRVRVHPTRP